MIQDYNSFNLETVVYGTPKKYEKYCTVSMFEKTEEKVNKIYFQTPKIKVAGPIMNDETESYNTYVDFVIEDDNYKSFVKTMDEFVMNKIKENAPEWFPGKTFDDTFLEVGHVKSLLKSGVMKYQILENNVIVYDESKNTISLNEINLNDTIRGIVRPVGLWFTANRWGITWNLEQIKKCKTEKQKKLVGYMFPDEDDENDDSDEMDACPPPGI
jgi:hypothetical protein